jgi:hypothetical protein
MRKVIDMTGKVYGRLTVLNSAGTLAGYKDYHWNCLCSCGKKVTIRGIYLRNGSSRSCGCLHREVVALNNKKRIGTKYNVKKEE